MPSRDSTGKRLSGAAQRRQAGEKKAGPGRGEAPPREPATGPLRATPPPPLAQGVDAVATWTTSVQARAAWAALQGGEPERVRALTTCCRAFGALRSHALASELALKTRVAHGGRVTDATREEPALDDPISLPTWAACRVATLAHLVATADAVDFGAVSARCRALESLAKCPPTAAIDLMADDLERATVG